MRGSEERSSRSRTKAREKARTPEESHRVSSKSRHSSQSRNRKHKKSHRSHRRKHATRDSDRPVVATKPLVEYDDVSSDSSLFSDEGEHSYPASPPPSSSRHGADRTSERTEGTSSKRRHAARRNKSSTEVKESSSRSSRRNHSDRAPTTSSTSRSSRDYSCVVPNQYDERDVVKDYGSRTFMGQYRDPVLDSYYSSINDTHADCYSSSRSSRKRSLSPDHPRAYKGARSPPSSPSPPPRSAKRRKSPPSSDSREKDRPRNYSPNNSSLYSSSRKVSAYSRSRSRSPIRWVVISSRHCSFCSRTTNTNP